MFTLGLLHHKAEAKRTDKSYTNPYRNLAVVAGGRTWETRMQASNIKEEATNEHKRPSIL